MCHLPVFRLEVRICAFSQAAGKARRALSSNNSPLSSCANWGSDIFPPTPVPPHWTMVRQGGRQTSVKCHFPSRTNLAAPSASLVLSFVDQDQCATFGPTFRGRSKCTLMQSPSPRRQPSHNFSVAGRAEKTSKRAPLNLKRSSHSFSHGAETPRALRAQPWMFGRRRTGADWNVCNRRPVLEAEL